MATRKTTGRVTAPKDQQPQSQPTSASAWKKGKTEGLLVRVPSGNTALIRTPGMDVFLQNGTIPNSLVPIVQASLATGKGPKDEDLVALMEDQETLNKIITLANDVLVQCCIDPVVEPAPTNEAGEVLPFNSPERDPEVLYADEVDFTDKMFIFGVATGGTQNVERFREQSGLDVGVVSTK